MLQESGNGIRGACFLNQNSQANPEGRYCNDYTQGIECAASGGPAITYPVRSRECPERVVTLREELRGCGVQEMVSRIVIAFWPVILFAGICLPASAQAGSVQDATAPAELVRDTVAREVAAANDSSAKYMFRAWKKTPQGSQTRLYVETKDAMAGMTIAYNDKPIGPEQLQGEERRLAGLASNPEQLRHKQRQEKEESEHTLRIVKALPDAFLYDSDGS